jgi:hypothetical protein
MAYQGLVVEGFDHLTAADLLTKRVGSTGGVVILAGAGPFGSSAVQLLTNVAYRCFLDPTGGGAAYSKLVAHVPYYCNLLSTNDCVIAFTTGIGGTKVFELQVDTAGHPRVLRNGTVIATSATILSVDTWYMLEVKVELATGATGSYEVHLEGTPLADLTASGVQTSSATTATALQLHGNIGISHYDDLLVQDWSVAGVDFTGPIRVATGYPTADGHYVDFSLSSGSVHRLNVDEATANGDTDFNYSSTAGQRDSFAHTGLPVSGTPLIVQLTAQARKDDAGARTHRNFLRIGSTDYDGADHIALSGYQAFLDIWNANPGGGAWTQAVTDPMEIGYTNHA